MFGIRIGIFLSFVAVIAISQPAEAQNGAKVLSVQGTVDREQPPWVPLTVNLWLPVGAKVRTGDQSRAVLLLADETQLKLNANTEVQLATVREASTLFTRIALSASRSQESVLNLSKGQVWLRARNKPADVKVATPAVTAAIRGTEFDLRVGDDGESIITVLEGAVDYRNAFGAVQVNTGEQGRARVGEAPTKTVLLNPADAVQWTLVYSGAVSPRDYPVRYPSVAAARTAVATAAPGLATAEARHDAGDATGALRALDGLATPEAAELRGWILLEQNRPAEALAAFAMAVPDSPRTRLGQSIAALRLRRFTDAYRAVETGGDTRLAVQKAQLELLSGDAAAARQTLEAVPPVDPVYPQARALLSNVYLVQDRKDDARRAADEAVAAAPDSPTAYLAVSLVEQSMFDLPAATRAVTRARSLDPSFVQADIQYANLRFGAGDTSEAARTILRVLAEAPGEAMAHSTLGFIQLSRGQNVEAQASLNMALSLDDTQGEPHLGLGILAMREGRHEDAVAEFLTAAALEPRRSLYQTYLGKALYELRRFDQSFASLASAEQLDPRDPTPHLYAGVFQNDLLRPGVAVREFEQSIALNDGRAVYRSRFLLDQDLASRNVNLATAYGQLGLAEWANHHALESEAASVDDSSAHLFLAGTFLNLKGRVNAGGGELLMSRLLGAPNVNTFNALNTYTTLFDRPRADWGMAQSVGTFKSSDSELSAYGGTSQLAYSAVWGYFRSDGFRPVNDDRHDWSGANLFKVALSPHSSLLVSYIHFNTQQGNHGGGLSSLVSDENNPVKRLTSSLDRGEIGYHMQFRPGSDLLVYFAAQVDHGISDDPQATFGYLHTTSTLRTPAYDYQMSHLFKVARLQLRYGVDLYKGTERSDVNSNLILPLDPPIEVPYSSTSTTTDIQYRTLFAQATYPVSRHLAATFGINYDWANHDDFFLESPQSTGKWNPSAGLSFSPTRSTTLRVALMHVLQTHYMDRIVPAHVSGFPLEQNESPMSESIGYNVGWDQRFGPNTFLRTTAFTRRRLIPLGDDLCGFVSCDNTFYGGGIVLNRMLTERWTVVPEYTLTHTTDIFGARHEHEGTIRAVYVRPDGLAFRLSENYFHQRGSTFTGDAANVAVFTTNASVSYALPNKRGTLFVSASNLTDRRYAFLADPLALDPRVPRRRANLGLQLSF